jgi:O-antigen ligase/tetratricopeptide (TPR) repeat protein
MVQRINAHLVYQCCLGVEICWLAVLLLVPLAFNPAGAYVFEPIKVSLFRSLAALGLLVIVLDKPLDRERLTIREGLARFIQYPLATPILFVAFICVLTTLFSMDPVMSFWGRCSKMHGTYTLLSYVFIWAMIARYLKSDTQIHRVFKAICLTSGLVGMYAMIQWLRLDPIPWQSNFGERVFSTLAHPNALGAYMAMTIPITISTAFLSLPKRPNKFVFFATILLIQVLTLIKSSSRASIVGAVVALLFFIITGVVRFCRVRHFLRIMVVITLCLTVLVAFQVIPNVSPVGNAFVSPGRLNTVVSRLLIWQASLELALQRPILGFGPDAFALAFQSVYPPTLAHFEGYGVTPDRAHNLLLDALVMNGAFGFAGLLVFWATFYIKTLVFIRNSELFPWYMVAIVAAFTAYVIQGLFSFDTVTSGSLLWILVGIASVLMTRSMDGAKQQLSQQVRPQTTGQKREPGWFRVVLVSVVLCSVLLANLRFNLVNIWRGQGQRATFAGDFQNGADAYSRAAAMCPECGEDLAHLANALLGRFRGTGDVTFLQVAESVLLLAQQRDPHEASHYVNLGHLYLSWGTVDFSRLEQAIRAYQQAIALGPFYPQYHDYLGLAYEMSGRLGAANSAFDRALNLDPLYVPTYVRRGALYQKRGDDDLAKSYFLSAVNAYMTWSAIDPGIIRARTFQDELTAAYGALAQISYEKGEITKALHFSRKLVELYPSSEVGRINLVLIYQNSKGVERARAEALTALESFFEGIFRQLDEKGPNLPGLYPHTSDVVP